MEAEDTALLTQIYLPCKKISSCVIIANRIINFKLKLDRLRNGEERDQIIGAQS